MYYEEFEFEVHFVLDLLRSWLEARRADGAVIGQTLNRRPQSIFFILYGVRRSSVSPISTRESNFSFPHIVIFLPPPRPS